MNFFIFSPPPGPSLPPESTHTIPYGPSDIHRKDITKLLKFRDIRFIPVIREAFASAVILRFQSLRRKENAFGSIIWKLIFQGRSGGLGGDVLGRYFKKYYRISSYFFVDRSIPLCYNTHVACEAQPQFFGVWRSLVAHVLWEHGAAGSNPVTPIAARPLGQAVKTPPFHGGNTGSSPVEVAILFTVRCGPLAQWLEQSAHNRSVRGSSP